VLDAAGLTDPSEVIVLRHTIRPKDTTSLRDFATDGSGRLVLRNYNRAYLYDRPRSEAQTVELPSAPMGETVAILGNGDLLIGSEGPGSQIIRVPASARETP
jgi:hypothetical protein